MLRCCTSVATTFLFNLKCKSLNSHFALVGRWHGVPRLGVNKGIHTVIIAMTSCNDVIAIFLFGVLCGVVFSTGNLAHQLLQGPVGIVMGCVFGGVSGLLVLRLPADKAVRKNLVALKWSQFEMQKVLVIRFR